MAPPITIRNITTTQLTLKLIERFESPGAINSNLGGVLSNIGRNFTSLITNSTTDSIPSKSQLQDSAQSFNSQETDVQIEPFTIYNSDINIVERSGSEILRLTFESADRERYRIDLPPHANASTIFTPLVPNPQHAYTGIFVAEFSFLAIFSSANLGSWMKELKDSTSLTALSLPGTHNSPTYYRALPSVRCQAVSPIEQLQNGVRFFDIRVQPERPDEPKSDGLFLVHGVFPISLTGFKQFRVLLNDVYKFLDENPSETIVMSLKREGPGTHTDAQLSKILHDHYVAREQSKWWVDPRIPSLGEARGKIILLRRFGLDDSIRGDHDGRGWAVDAENWAYNTPNHTNGFICVQDFCEVLETENIDVKIKYSCEHLQRSSALRRDGSSPLYLNFLSGSNFWKVGCWPEKIAAKLNPAVVQHLCIDHAVIKEENGATGIVVCDWVGEGGNWDLIRAVVGWNSRLEYKQ